MAKRMTIEILDEGDAMMINVDVSEDMDRNTLDQIWLTINSGGLKSIMMKSRNLVHKNSKKNENAKANMG